jgi:ribosomal protein L11 methyltransferase
MPRRAKRRTRRSNTLHCPVPYRIDIPTAGADSLDRLIELGALDVDERPGGGVAAVMPDRVETSQIAAALGVERVRTSPAIGRDAGSVWVLAPRVIRSGRLSLVPADWKTTPSVDTIRLVDSPAFGTGLHATTALCLEILQDILDVERPHEVLDVGTGSGVLALAALALGVPSVVGIDIEEEAVRAAAENARINGMADRLPLVCGGPEAVAGQWPLILANVLAAPLIEMASALARRLGHRGQVVLSGIPVAVEGDVRRAYERQGLSVVPIGGLEGPSHSRRREGWVAMVFRAGW